MSWSVAAFPVNNVQASAAQRYNKCVLRTAHNLDRCPGRTITDLETKFIRNAGNIKANAHAGSMCAPKLTLCKYIPSSVALKCCTALMSCLSMSLQNSMLDRVNNDVFELLVSAANY